MKKRLETTLLGLTLAAAVAAAWVLTTGAAFAQERPGGPGRHDNPPPRSGTPRAEGPHTEGPRVAAPRVEAPRGWVLDGRYHHDHYYPATGHIVPRLPGGAVSIDFGGAAWFFRAGVWFRPIGGRFVVTLPPVGIVVSDLPGGCTTLAIAGLVYYYANGVYYRDAPDGYVVVEAPRGAESAQPVAAAASAAAPKPPPEPIIYPKNGQTAEQTEIDRRECNRWATTQPSAMADASVFQRAVAACLEGRGYTVR